MALPELSDVSTKAIFQYLSTITLIFVVLTPVSAYADTLPENGMTMDTVRASFGAPEKTLPPVGTPPITRWVYPDYTVYFEYNLTLDTVYHQPASAHDAITDTGTSQRPTSTVSDNTPTDKPAVRPGFHYDAASGRIVPGT